MVDSLCKHETALTSSLSLSGRGSDDIVIECIISWLTRSSFSRRCTRYSARCSARSKSLSCTWPNKGRPSSADGLKSSSQKLLQQASSRFSSTLINLLLITLPGRLPRDLFPVNPLWLDRADGHVFGRFNLEARERVFSDKYESPLENGETIRCELRSVLYSPEDDSNEGTGAADWVRRRVCLKKVSDRSFASVNMMRSRLASSLSSKDAHMASLRASHAARRRSFSSLSKHRTLRSFSFASPVSTTLSRVLYCVLSSCCIFKHAKLLEDESGRTFDDKPPDDSECNSAVWLPATRSLIWPVDNSQYTKGGALPWHVLLKHSVSEWEYKEKLWLTVELDEWMRYSLRFAWLPVRLLQRAGFVCKELPSMTLRVTSDGTVYGVSAFTSGMLMYWRDMICSIQLDAMWRDELFYLYISRKQTCVLNLHVACVNRNFSSTYVLWKLKKWSDRNGVNSNAFTHKTCSRYSRCLLLIRVAMEIVQLAPRVKPIRPCCIICTVTLYKNRSYIIQAVFCSKINKHGRIKKKNET